jgi:hypothetical protein
MASASIVSNALIEGITHRILAYLFMERLSQTNAPDSLRRFFYYFDVYATLVIWKV